MYGHFCYRSPSAYDTGMLSWDAANAKCKTYKQDGRQAYLAAPHSEAENSAVKAFCTADKHCWLGFTDRWLHNVPGTLKCRSSPYQVTGKTPNMGGNILNDRGNGPWVGADGSWGTGNPDYGADTSSASPWSGSAMCQTDFT